MTVECSVTSVVILPKANYSDIYLLCVYHPSVLLIRGRGRGGSFAGLKVYANIIIIFSVAESICADLCYLFIGRTMLIVIRTRTLFSRQYLCASIVLLNVAD